MYTSRAVLCLLLAASHVVCMTPSTPLTQGTLGLVETVIYDKTTQPTDDVLRADCPLWRARKTSFNYNGSDTEHIYYTTTQCMDSSDNVKYQQVFFAYNENDPGVPLPPGCPPPSIAPPAESNECGDASKMGAEFVRIVSRLTVPVLIKDVLDNPLQNTSAFANYLNISSEMQQAAPTNFSPDQQQVLNDLLNEILPIVRDKVNCVMNIVTPADPRLGIFGCAKAGVNQSIKATVLDVLNEEIQCGYVGCRGLSAGSNSTYISTSQNSTNSQNSSSSPTGQGSSSSSTNQGSSSSSTSQGSSSASNSSPTTVTASMLTPNSGQNYMIVSASTGLAVGVAQPGAGDNFLYLQSCTGDITQQWNFTMGTQGTWSIYSQGGQGYIGNTGDQNSNYFLSNDTSDYFYSSYNLLQYGNLGFSISTPGNSFFGVTFADTQNPTTPATQGVYLNSPVTLFLLVQSCTPPFQPLAQPSVPFSPAIQDNTPYYIINSATNLALYTPDLTNPWLPLKGVSCGTAMIGSGSILWKFFSVGPQQFLIANNDETRIYNSSPLLLLNGTSASLVSQSTTPVPVLQLNADTTGRVTIQNYNDPTKYLISSTGITTQVSGLSGTNSDYFRISATCP